MIRFGVHCSLRGGLLNSLEEAHRLGCESMQIFTRSPRVWKMRMPPSSDIAAFKARRRQLGITPLVVHTPYLPNLATSKEKLYKLSTKCLAEDLDVAERLEADYLVIHPGSYSEGSTPEKGISRIARAINSVLAKIPGKTRILLENAAGGGRRLAGNFDEIAAMLEGIRDKHRAGVCFDTAHALAAGYDVSSKAGVYAVFREFKRKIGLDYLKVVHLNDSLAPAGSRRDRHQHIGKGFIGQKGFLYLIQYLTDKADAGILETPKEPVSADSKNLKLLFKLRNMLQ